MNRQTLNIYTQEDIQRRIFTIRGVQVMLDRDLALLYQVSTGRLNEAVKRNKDRFPDDFMFQLTDEETANWKSQIAITNSIKMGLRHNPYAFTEEGISQLSHDRWLIIDDTVYHFGVSLKDLGKKWFSVDAITEHTADDFISRL